MTIEKLARLVPVTEVPELSADDDALLRLGQAIEARCRRAREYGLAHAIDEPTAEPFRVEAEHKHADARPAVRRLLRQEVGFDARFDLASDD